MPNRRKEGKSAHTFWIAEPLWQAVKAKARQRGEDVTKVAIRAFEEYLK